MAKEKAYEANCVKLILLKEGIYDLEEDLLITCPISIHGAGQNKTIMQGKGITIKGTKEKNKRVDMQGMTMKGPSESGLGPLLNVVFMVWLRGRQKEDSSIV